MENETKLLTCPFCGGEAEVWEDKMFGTFIPQCPNCNTTHGRFTSRENAVKAWNTRNVGDKASNYPKCFISNNGVYPLCKGNDTEECHDCYFYEDYEVYHYPYNED